MTNRNEIFEMQQKIKNEINAILLANPDIEDYLKNRIKQEEENRKLKELENQRKGMEEEYNIMKNDILKLIEEKSPTFSADISKFTELSDQFQTRTAAARDKSSMFSNLGNVLDDQWNESRQKFLDILTYIKDQKSSLSQDISIDINNSLSILNVQFEQKMQEMLISYVKNKTEESIKNKDGELRKLIQKPADQIIEAATVQAKKIDLAETITINSIHKLANLLNTGEYDLPFWKKFSIFAKNLSTSSLENNLENIGFKNEKSWENLCKNIKSDFDSGDFEAIPNKIDSFYSAEQTKMENALTDLEGAIENVMNKEDGGEELINKILENAKRDIEKEINDKLKPITIAKQVYNASNRVDAIVGHFNSIKNSIDTKLKTLKKDDSEPTVAKKIKPQ